MNAMPGRAYISTGGPRAVECATSGAMDSDNVTSNSAARQIQILEFEHPESSQIQQQSVIQGDASWPAGAERNTTEAAAEDSGCEDMHMDGTGNRIGATAITSHSTALSLEVDDTERDERRDCYGNAKSILSPTIQYPKSEYRYRPEHSYEDSTMIGSTTSIYDGEADFVWEHGRRYCKEYFMPNDEDEQDRLRILHQIYLNIFNLELTTVPLDDPEMILDVGTGTGEWAMGMAERFPHCDVIGIDISPIAERAVPINCHWEVDDAEIEWERPTNSIDMVHFRSMSGAFSDWSFIYGQAYRCLKPGGYVEVLEFHDHEGDKNFYDRFPPQSAMHQTSKDIEKAEVIYGKHRGIDHMEPDLLIDAGFVDVEVTEHIVPLDPSNSPLGKLWLVTLRAGFESYSLRLLTKYMGYDATRVRMACESVGQQMIAMATNPTTNKGFQIKLRVTIARKPLVPGQWTTDRATETSTEYHHGHSGAASITGSDRTVSQGSQMATPPGTAGVQSTLPSASGQTIP